MEQFALRLAREQRRLGHDASVMAARGGPLVQAAAEMGVPAAVLRGAGPVRRGCDAVARMIGGRAEVVHAHNPPALRYAMLARAVGRPVLLMTRHGQQTGRLLTSMQWRLTDAVVAVSESAAVALRSACPGRAGKITLIRNGVEPAAARRGRDAVRRELGLTDEVVGIIAARLDPLKGHADLLHAVELLPPDTPPTVLLVAGEGPERDRLETMARESRLAPGRVRFLGYRSDVIDLMTAVDFFVLPSLLEGLPLSVLEAMSCGLPVIATPVGGIPEVVTDGENGLLVPHGDPAALSHALARLSGEPSLRERLGEAGRRRVSEAFSFAAMTRSYLDLYWDLAHRGRHPRAPSRAA